MSGIKIMGTGSCLPKNEVGNEIFATMVETDDEWITTRTGIHSRHISTGETNHYLAKIACERAIENAGIEKGEIGLVICATFTNEYLTPSLACLLQQDLGLPEEILSFDLNAACSGFVYALQTASALLAQMPGKYALVSGSEILSGIVDFTDRSTCVLFGDGAGAVVLRASETPFYFSAGTQGGTQALSCLARQNAANPFREENDAPGFVHMNGAEVFRFAVESSCKSILATLQKAHRKIEDIQIFLCHQANARIITSVAKKLKAPINKFYMNLATHGNTSAASIPIALDELNRKAGLREGDTVVLSGFGGGLTYGAACFNW